MTVAPANPSTLLPAVRSPNLLFPGVTLSIGPTSSPAGRPAAPGLRVPADGYVVQQALVADVPAGYGTVARVCGGSLDEPGGMRLRGVMRVRITESWHVAGFAQVGITPVDDAVVPGSDLLGQEVKRAALGWLVSQPRLAWAFDALLGTEDPARVADLVCQALFQDCPEFAGLLGLSLDARLRACAQALPRHGRDPVAAEARPLPVVVQPAMPPAVSDQWASFAVRPVRKALSPGPPAPVARPTPPPRPQEAPAAAPTSGPPTSEQQSPERRDPIVVRPPSELRTFADVGGMDKLKRELRRTVGVLIRQPQAVRDLDYRFSGVLLHGPPGVGKSYIAEATAGEFGMSLLRVCIGDILSCWVGDSERRLREIFATAHRSAPCLVFLDEFDAIAARRGRGGAGDTFDRRLLDQLLVLLEEVDSHAGVVVMAATNDVHALDPSAIREGRFDRQVFVDLPDREARIAIFSTHLRHRRVEGAIDLDELADRSVGLTAAAIKAVVVASAGLAIERYEDGETVNPRITEEVLDRAIRERRGQDRPMLERRGWDDLILAADTVTELRRLVRMIANPDEMRRRGLRPVTGALLCGPPGTGKSTVARVIASETEGAVNFYSVRGSDLLSGTLGSSSARVRDLFVRARQYAPAIIFIDEIDALLHRRGIGSDSASQERDTVIAEFLSQMDGLGTRPGVFVLGATNLPDKLDPAVRRSGRLTRTIQIPLPDRNGRVALLRLFTGPMSLASDVDLVELAGGCDGMSGADIEALCAEAGYQTLEREGDATVHAADFGVARLRLDR